MINARNTNAAIISDMNNLRRIVALDTFIVIAPLQSRSFEIYFKRIQEWQGLEQAVCSSDHG